jgi:hypothetical protein
MAKKKEVKEIKEKIIVSIPDDQSKDPILPLSIDYNNEGLNNIARKINEIIERIF